MALLWLLVVLEFFPLSPETHSVWAVELGRKELVDKHQSVTSPSFYTSAAPFLEALAVCDPEVTGTMLSCQMKLSVMLWAIFKYNPLFSGMILHSPSCQWSREGDC